MASTAVEKKASPVLGYDPDFGQRLAGEELYHDPNSGGSDFIDPRFGGLVQEGTYSLRDALPAMANNARDPEVAEVLREAGIENPFAPFTLHVLGEPFKVVAWRDNRWHADGKVRGLRYQITAPDKEQLTDKLIRLGQRVQAESIHELTESERLQVIRRAQAGDVAGAICLFCELAIGQGRASQYANANEMLADPALSEVFDEAALLTWFASRSNAQDTPDFRRFLMDYAGDRPLTHQLCDSAWAAWGPHQEKQSRQAAVARFAKPEQPSAEEVREGLDELSNEEINRTFWATARHVARAAR